MSFSCSVRQDDPRLLERMDPGWWNPEYDTALQASQLPLFELGEFITEITYGAIVTGEPLKKGPLKIIGQGQLATGGLDLREAQQVPLQSAWDIPRARIQSGDILMCRSGVAGVAKGRLTVCLEEPEAVVGSFVNRIAVHNIEPVWVMLALRSQFVQMQIQRIINGVGTPNINFSETCSLKIPVPDEKTQVEITQYWVSKVIPLHNLWVAGNNLVINQIYDAIRELENLVKQLIYISK